MTDLLVYPATAPLVGSVPAPADVEIAQLALAVAAIASGRSRISLGSAVAEDVRLILGLLSRLGVPIREEGGVVEVAGVGLHGLRQADGDLDCGRSRSTFHLLAGLLCASPFASRLTGHPSLAETPLERLARPLRSRGARLEARVDPARVGQALLPLEVGPLPPPGVPSGLEFDLPAPDARVKAAVLLSGLYADQPTYLSEPLVSADHAERMLKALNIPILTEGPMICVAVEGWSGEIPAFELEVPGDLSSAACLAAAATLVAGSRVDVRRVGINRTRAGVFDVLRDMSASTLVVSTGDVLGEPLGDVQVASAALRAAQVGGELVTRSIADLAALGAAAAYASGTTRITDAAELVNTTAGRAAPSSSLTELCRVLTCFGVRAELGPGSLVIHGSSGAPLRAADVDCQGDDRLTMMAAVLGLVADGPTRVRGAESVARSFPRFVGTLRALGARIEVAASERASA